MNRWIFILFSLYGLHSFAQHPFYLQVFDEAKLAMDAGDYLQAAQDLEIAAFGFMEKEALLAEACIRLVLSYKELNQQEKVDLYLRDVERQLASQDGKPADLPQPMWESFLVVSGRKAPPAPPVPEGETALLAYVQNYPDNTDAWMGLIDAQVAARKTGKLRQTFGQAMAAHPENAGILSKALIFSMNQDKGRGAEALANKLLILRPDSPMANEVLGGLAVEQRAWDQATAHYQWVPVAQFPKTSDYQKRLKRALENRKAAEEIQKQPSELQPEANETEVLVQEKATQEGSRTDADASATMLVETSDVPVEVTPEVEQPAGGDVSTETPLTDVTQEPPVTEVASGVVENTKPAIDYQARVDALERLVRQEPGNPDPKFDLVSAYVGLGDMRKAKKQLARLARRYNTHPRYAETYAYYQYAKGAYQVNIDNLSAFQNDLRGASAYYLGMSYYRMGRLDDAKAILKRLDAKTFEMPADLGLDRDAAIGTGGGFQQVQSISKLSRSEAVDWLASMASQGNWQAMDRDLGQIIASYPADKDIRFFQARALMGQGQYSEAMPYFIELVGEGYEANEIFYYAGLTALRKGDASVANYLFERAQDNDSKFSEEIERLLANR